MGDPRLRDKLNDGQFIAAPGIHDMISAIVANSLDVGVVYASGYWLSASAYGLPDAGIVTYTEMLDRVQQLVTISDGTVIADADTGYGGLLNVERTVRGYEAAGVAAIQLEDQCFPKVCSHTMTVSCVPTDVMVKRIKVACATRDDQRNTLIIGRTDARAVESFTETLNRARAYVAAGADIIFIEALRNEDEMRKACTEIDVPMMVNMNDGAGPTFTAKELRELGYQVAIWPSFLPLAVVHCVKSALSAFLETGSSSLPGLALANFQEFSTLIGFDKVREFARTWGPE